MKLSEKELQQWEQFIYETTNGATKAAQTGGQPVVINVYIDNSINVQSVSTASPMPVRLIDNRERLSKHLPANYQPGNMDITAEKIAATPNYTYLPLTKEERANSGGFGY